MLSTGAFNALLKTLEEPPEHVKFILATTEPQKLPATILSRCQRFDFKRISNEDIIKRLKVVCNESNIEISEGALNIIAVLSEGAMRDALSILERCIQDGENKIDENKIKDLVGIPKLSYVNSIISAILEYDLDEVVKSTNQILNEGKDLDNFLWEMIKYVKDILVYKSCKNLELYTQDEILIINNLANKYSNERLIELIYELSELQNNMKWSTQKSILFQAGMIKLCYKKSQTVDENLEQRVEKIENYLRSNNIENRNINNNSYNSYNNYSTGPMQNNINNTVKNTVIESKSNLENKNIVSSNSNIEKNAKNPGNKASYSGKIEEAWPKIVRDLKQNGKIVLYTNLMQTKAIEVNDMTVGIQFPNGLSAFGKTVLEKQENIREISNLVSMACGKEMQIKYIEGTNAKANSSMSVEDNIKNFANEADIPFNVIE